LLFIRIANYSYIIQTEEVMVGWTCRSGEENKCGPNFRKENFWKLASGKIHVEVCRVQWRNSILRM